MPAHQEGDDGGARGGRALSRRRLRSGQDRRDSRDPQARRSGSAGAAWRPAVDAHPRQCESGGRRHRIDPERLAIWTALQNAWYGLSLGSVLLLAAIGLAITFGVMGVINMAHGEMVMLGAYTTFVVQEVIRARNPGLVRLFARDCDSARIPGRGAHRHPDRARHHPLSLWPAARDPARHLGALAHAAAGGAHHLRADQQATWARRPG